jgi:hypothetical protein
MAIKIRSGIDGPNNQEGELRSVQNSLNMAEVLALQVMTKNRT